MREEEILAWPEFASVAGEFCQSGAVELPTLLAASAEFTSAVGTGGADVGVADALTPSVPMLLTLGLGDRAIAAFTAGLAGHSPGSVPSWSTSTATPGPPWPGRAAWCCTAATGAMTSRASSPQATVSAGLRFAVEDPDECERQAAQDAAWGRFVMLADPDGRSVVLARMNRSDGRPRAEVAGG